VDQALGIMGSALNDDRIARALDAVAPELDRIVGSVGAQAIAAFGLDVSRLHWDMTSVSLYGAYEQTDPDHPAPKFGHPKDRRPDLKQIQTGLAVTGDGAVPVFHRAYSGGAGEVSQVSAAMQACRDLAGPRRFLLVGDSKLVSYTNLCDMVAAGVEFIAPAWACHDFRVSHGRLMSLAYHRESRPGKRTTRVFRAIFQPHVPVPDSPPLLLEMFRRPR
jgi:transposase